MTATLTQDAAQLLDAALTFDDENALADLIEGHVGGLTVDTVDEEGRTLLYLASEKGRIRCVDRLLSLGARVNTLALDTDQSKPRTPLNAAIRAGHYDVAETLLAAGASVRLTDHHGQTPAHFAILGSTPQGNDAYQRSSHRRRLDLLVQIVEAGCPINQLDGTGRNILNAAFARFATSLGGNSIYLPFIEKLLDLGANPNATNGAGEQPLHRYTDDKHGPLIRLLISRGADVNGRDRRGRTPLFHAKDFSTVETLVAHGADVNLVDNDGRTVFHHLAVLLPGQKMRTAEMLFLLQHGADPHVIDFTGESAAMLIQGTQLRDDPALQSVRTMIAAYDAKQVMRTVSAIRVVYQKP